MPDTTEDILFQAGDVLFDTKEPLSMTYFILEGRVDLELSLGAKTLTLQIDANNFVGDAAVAVGQKPDAVALSYKARAVACGAVKAVAIPVADIRRELDACPPLLKAWFASFTSRVLRVIDQLSQPE